MFWSGAKLDRIKREKGIITEGEGKIDCASIVLTIGTEVYITPNSELDSKVKTQLTEKKTQFVLPKGQFALILTQEIVEVPKNAIAFISFKAKYKYKGLINVSGFHVDPGWKGRLIFSVYNAGPSDVVLEKGLPFALIWYADLDMDKYETHSSGYQKYVRSPDEKQHSLDSQKISDMTGEIFSPFKLKKDIDDLKEKYSKEINDLRKEVSTLEGKLLTRHLLLVIGMVSILILLLRLPSILKAANDFIN